MGIKAGQLYPLILAGSGAIRDHRGPEGLQGIIDWAWVMSNHWPEDVTEGARWLFPPGPPQGALCNTDPFAIAISGGGGGDCCKGQDRDRGQGGLPQWVAAPWVVGY